MEKYVIQKTDVEMLRNAGVLENDITGISKIRKE